MEHRGYTGTVEYDAVEGIFQGRVMDLNDTITYEAMTEELLECAFRDAVDEYLDQCYACEQEPERPPSAISAAADPLSGTRSGPGDRPRPAAPDLLIDLVAAPAPFSLAGAEGARPPPRTQRTSASKAPVSTRPSRLTCTHTR